VPAALLGILAAVLVRAEFIRWRRAVERFGVITPALVDREHATRAAEAGIFTVDALGL
jgi:hypothetical protein